MKKSWLKRWLPGLALVALTAIALAGNRGLPAQHGILNFGKVCDHLYRGAQPDHASVARLKELGVKTIIDLRIGREVRAGEAADAATNGILYTNVPFRGLSAPSAEKINRLLDLIDASPGPVFIHCEHGCDRTGTVIACYRMRHDHWSYAESMQEANIYGISPLEIEMRKFIKNYAATIKR